MQVSNYSEELLDALESIVLASGGTVPIDGVRVQTYDDRKLEILRAIAGAAAVSTPQVGTDKPTTRPDGEPLEVGDRWFDTGSQVERYWDGSRWLSTQVYYIDCDLPRDNSPYAFTSYQFGGLPINPAGDDILLLQLEGSFNVDGPYTETDRWTASINGRTASDGSTLIGGGGLVIPAATYDTDRVNLFLTYPADTIVDVSTTSFLGIYHSWVKSGSGDHELLGPSSTRLYYRLSKP